MTTGGVVTTTFGTPAATSACTSSSTVMLASGTTVATAGSEGIVTNTSKAVLSSRVAGRAQTVMLALARLKAAGEIPPDLPVFLDSPMAIDATGLYRKYRQQHRLSVAECRAMCSVARLVNTPDQSRALAGLRMPSVIIAASGMATGGRVLHHLKARAPDPRNAIVLAGFQVGGRRGARLLAGEPAVKIHGEMVPVRAEVQQLEGFSGHADRAGLLAWLHQLPQAPRQTYVVHGEPDAADSLRAAIRNELGWPARVPALGESVTL